MRTAALRLAGRALRSRVGVPCELASLRSAEAACAPCSDRVSRTRLRDAPHGSRGFSASGAPPPPGGGGDSEPTPEERELRPKWGALDELYWSAQEWKARGLLQVYRRFIEPTFDEALFLDGAADAYLAVNELWPAGDAAGLAPLTTPPVAEAFASMLEGYKAEGMSVLFKTVAFHRARITDFSLVTRGEFRRRGPRPAVAAASADPEAADDGGGGYEIPGVGRLFISFTVRYDVEDEVELRRGGPTGPIMMKMRDCRGHAWQFVRPLPKEVPFEGTDTPWRLMDIA